MNYPTNYEFLEMDLNDCNKLIMDLCSMMSELWIKGKRLSDEYFKVKKQKDIYRALLTLQLNDIVYKDEWRDKWIIKEEIS